MPELPEVETVLTGLKPHLEGAIIKDVLIRHRALRWPIDPNLKRYLTNQRIGTMTRRAKYVLIPVAEGTLIMHLGMSGSLRILTEINPINRHDHMDIILSNGQLLRYTDPRRFGAILWTTAAPLMHPLLKSLGVEPLENGFTADYLFDKARSRKVPIKSFIMNGHVVVGVGNIYAAEALFLAKIHPESPAGLLSFEHCVKLVDCIKTVLQTAIEQGGTTVKDFVNSQGKPGYFVQKLNVYGREGKPCTTCNMPLQSFRLGQRATVCCNHCQPKLT